MQSPIVRHLNQIANERWTRQAIRTLLRAAWVALCAWCIVVGASLVLRWEVDLAIAGAIALLVVGVALVRLLLTRAMPATAVARRFDRRFRLNEELATAVEVASQNPPSGSLSAALLERSAHTLRLVRRQIRTRQAAPWSDVITLLALLLVAAGLFVMIGIGRPLPDAVEQPLPPLAGDAGQPPVDQPIDDAPRDQPPGLAGANGQPGDQPGDAQAGAGQGQGSGQSQAGQQAGDAAQAGDQGQANGQEQASAPPSPERQREMDAVADALRDQGITRPAAEALDRGNASEAAQELRSLADSASQISPQTRGELADALRDAARQVEQTNPDLAQQLRDSARGLERGDNNAAQALEDLAQAIESMQGPAQASQGQGDQSGGDQAGPSSGSGQQGQGQGDQPGSGGGAGNAGAAEQRPVQPAPRLGVDGKPVELGTEGPGAVPARPGDQATVASGGAIGAVSGGNSSSARDASGSDPLRVPADERDVVQEYFTP
jgi:hypothetical protein